MDLSGFFSITLPNFDEPSPMKDQACFFTVNMPTNTPTNLGPVAAYNSDIMTDAEYSHCKTCGDSLVNGEKDRGYCADCWSKMG